MSAGASEDFLFCAVAMTHYITFFNLARPATATATTTRPILLLLRNTSDLRNCTSYFGACMWVWYCRPPIGAHFHPTQPPPVPQQLGEKAHLRISWSVAAVLANATATPLVYPMVTYNQRAGAGAGPRRTAS